MNLATFHGLGWSPGAACVALALDFAVCNRLWGADKPAFKGKKALIFVLTVGAGTVTLGTIGALMAVVWFIERCIPFVKSSATPTNAIELLVALARFSVPAAAAYFAGPKFADPLLFPAMAGFAVLATTLSASYGQRKKYAEKHGEGDGGYNVFVELSHGLLFGLALGLGSLPLSALHLAA